MRHRRFHGPTNASNHREFGRKRHRNFGAHQCVGRTNASINGRHYGHVRPAGVVTPQPINNEGFRWGQFFFGLFVPFAVFGVVTIFAAALEPEWEDPWRYETVRAESEDAVNYSVQVSPTQHERFESAFGLIEHEGHTIYINVWNEYGSMTSTIYQTNESNYQSDADIGTYHVANQTMVFELEDASAEFMTIELSYIDERFEYQKILLGWRSACFLSFISLPP